MFQNLIVNGFLYSYQGQMGNCWWVIWNLIASSNKFYSLYSCQIFCHFKCFPLIALCIRAMQYILSNLHLFSKPSFILLESLQLTHFSLFRSIFVITAFLAGLLLGRFLNQEPIKVGKNLVILKFSKSLSRSYSLRLRRVSSHEKITQFPQKKNKMNTVHYYLFYQMLWERLRFYFFQCIDKEEIFCSPGHFEAWW